MAPDEHRLVGAAARNVLAILRQGRGCVSPFGLGVRGGAMGFVCPACISGDSSVSREYHIISISITTSALWSEVRRADAGAHWVHKGSRALHVKGTLLVATTLLLGRPIETSGADDPARNIKTVSIVYRMCISCC